jgi:hypothetical protein
MRGRWFVQIEIDEGWSTFTIVEAKESFAPVFAQAIMEVLREHPVIGRHPLRVATPAQVGSPHQVYLAEIRGHEEWLPEQVQMVRAHARERMTTYSGPHRSLARGLETGQIALNPVRFASRSISVSLEALEEAIRSDPRRAKFVAEDARLTVEEVDAVRAGGTLRARLVVDTTVSEGRRRNGRSTTEAR